jgi:peptidoglycan/LPS O-acetylase OafA/YrhL
MLLCDFWFSYAAQYRKIQTNNKYWFIDFYKSRLSRVMPIYWIFLFLTIVVFGLPILISFLDNNDFGAAAIYVFNNVTLVGQDILRFFTYDITERSFHLLPAFTDNFIPLLNQHVILGNAFTLMGQSWTLSVELWFYLLVPFILLRSNTILILVVMMGIVSRFLIAHYGYTYHTFMYGIIFNEIAIFIIGSLAARFYKSYLKSEILLSIIARNIDTKYAKITLDIIAYLLLILLLEQYYQGWRHFPTGGGFNQGLLKLPYAWWGTIAMTALSLPWLLYSIGSYKFDRFLGDLSYPIYISHFFILGVFSKWHIQENLIVLYTVIMSIIVSIVLIYLVERPMDSWRHKQYLKLKQI